MTWTDIEQGLAGVGLQLSGLTIDPADSQVLYVSTATGLFKSADRGESWALWNANSVASLAIDPSDPLTMYSMQIDVFSKSIDGGRTFVPVPAVRPLGYISPSQEVTLTINPLHPESIYAAAEGTTKYDQLGLFQSDTAGACWKQMRVSDEQLRGRLVSAKLAIDPGGGFVLAVTNIDNGKIYEFEFAPEIEPLCLPSPQPRLVSPRTTADHERKGVQRETVN
jgi:hypothetical protein